MVVQSLSPDMALGDLAKGSIIPMSTERSLIVAVDGTAAMGPYWKTVVSDYLEKIVRAFVGNEVPAQKSNCDLSLVMFNSHGNLSACMVQRSAWTKDVSRFLDWLSAMSFSGGGFNDAAIAEGLSEALMMFPIPPDGNLPPQSLDGKRHCVLVAATNPYPLSTPVYRPTFQLENEHVETYTGGPLCDAEGVVKFFPQCCVSLSVICPKQLPKLRAIYNAGKRNPRAADPPVDNVKNPHFLVLIAENFLEARGALSRPGTSSLPSNQSPVKMDTAPPPVNSVTAQPPTSVPPVNGLLLNRQAVSAGNGPPAIVKVEPTTVPSMVAGPTFSHISSVPRPTTQGVSALQTSSPSSVSQDMVTNNKGVPDLKPVVSGGISQRPGGPVNSSILNNISQARQVVNSAALTGGTSIRLQSMGQNPMAMHMSNMISTGMQSTVPAAQTGYSSAQSGITSVTGPGTLSGTIPTAQNPCLGSFAPATSNITGNSNIGISQPTGNLQVGPGMGQTSPGMTQGSLSGSQMVQNGVGMNPNMMSALGPTAPSSGTGTMIPTPGMPSQGQSGMQSINGNNNPGASMPLSQPSSSALQSAQSKYVKVWEGNLSGQRQGQPVLITKLEGYRSASASESLADNWPPTMQIVRLISQDHMNNKQYVGKADFLVFRAMNQHGFLGQLQEKKLCAVIQLPSQTLLLSVSDKACRLIGMLFPGDMVVFKPQIPSQQQQQQMQQQQQQMQQQLQAPPHPQMQQQQLTQMQQQQMPQQLQPQHQQMQMLPQQQQQMQQLQPQMPQLQQQQQQPQQHLQQLQPQHPQQQQLQQLQQHAPQQLMGTGMGQGYVQGPGRSQLMSQGPVSSQGLPNIPGGGFMS
ncbi:LOW QUALITY PROTEIN: mediator of RNA polymerase II transcription subunit 25 [Syzygium oleosum]|uniref:LOW QUALITY PROTEIN: mediator of RNA polymerase II transcription subunit 25 n=1 Tax=Syzygium oleosum TaxID=219896 RepID=UPI0024B8A0ED|nr:LOW QUALITY PROTEIN: mediator of RNA polymerase II transcription subunit 25 [Syzygium oleosum]